MRQQQHITRINSGALARARRRTPTTRLTPMLLLLLLLDNNTMLHSYGASF
jgi:hypothetical protein